MGLLDSAHIAAAKIEKLKIRQGVLCRLTGITSANLSGWLAGVRTLPASREREILATLRDLEALAEISPWPIGLNDPDRLEDSLRRLRAGDFECYRTLCAAREVTV